MFVIHKVRKSYVIACGIVLLIVISIAVNTLFISSPNSITCNTVENVRILIDDTFTVEDFLRQFDLQPNAHSKEKLAINIPWEFNAVYENYNGLQQKQGFDLSKHKGKYAVKYTYNIDNYATGAQVKANVIVCDNRVIAGDLCTVTLNGTMSTLDDKKIEE